MSHFFLQQGDDVVHHFKGDSSECLNTSGPESTIKRRGTTKGGKGERNPETCKFFKELQYLWFATGIFSVPTTVTSDDNGKSMIRLQLKKFLTRRPPKESLVKKGIYKGKEQSEQKNNLRYK